MTPLNFGGQNVEDLGVAYEAEVAAQTGAAIINVPIPAPAGRDGLGPALTLTYSSQAGNSAFGAGWNLSGLPTIGIDARRQVPRWDGRDTYVLGGDELVPWLEQEGSAWRPRGFDALNFDVKFYRSRFGGNGVRIEKWYEKSTGRVHFRTRDARNILTIYGARPNSTASITDPDNNARTYLWLPELQLDPQGNAVWMEYSPETHDGVDRALAWEHRRVALSQRYLKRLRYGNVTPLSLTPDLLLGGLPDGLDWCFQLVFDYGDHSHPDRPTADPDRPWPSRPDTFSTYRSGFEIRTHRLCKRILSFHNFSELGNSPTLVGALKLEHVEDSAGATLREVSYLGYRNDGTFITLPPLQLNYSLAATATGFIPVPVETQENVPAGFATRQYTFVDLLGDGLPGILLESERSLYYKPNLGNGYFGAQTVVLEHPAIRPGTFSYGDYDRDGDTDLTQLAGRLAGFFELDRQEARWQGFRPFSKLPHVEALGGHAQWVDLNGDGRPDVVIAKGKGLVWFPSEGDGFGDPVEIMWTKGINAPPLLAEDLTLDFFFADMNGDGLVDLVRIQNGRVEYWPNLGNGIFGEGILMGNSPRFAPDYEFDAGRLRFVDLDGSGTTDIIYIGHGEVTCWINANGNQLIPGSKLRGLPYFDQVSTVRILDFLGDGRPCLVWSSPLPGREAPIQHLPLSPDVRPRLLVSVSNSVGQETRFIYSSSATHYLRSQRIGQAWSSRLPTHVTVVNRREVFDHINATRSVTRFEYREGHFDSQEREFRGFGQVDVFDTALSEVTEADPESTVFAVPTITRMWFDLGTPMWNKHRPADTYTGDADLQRIPLHTIISEEALTEAQANDAFRALAGRTLRREIYTVDASGRRSAHPFEVFQAGYRVRRAQPEFSRARDAWSVTLAEELVATYEQGPSDPRVSHRLTIDTDAYDQVIRDAEVAYARRGGIPHEVNAQGEARILVHDHELVNIDESNRFELGVPVEGKDYEMFGVASPTGGLITRDHLCAAAITAALAAPRPHHEEPVGIAARLLSWEQSFYWNDERSAPLPLSSVGILTLIHHEEAASFTPSFTEDVYGVRANADRLTELGYNLRDGYYWKRDEIHHFGPRNLFSQRTAIEGRDGSRTTFTYDSYALEIIALRDALGNQTTADIDYHMLAPWRITDPNGTVSEVRYEALGVIFEATSYGTVDGEDWGFDPLSDVIRRSPAAITDVIANPGRYLQGSSGCTFYDLNAWQRGREPVTIVSLVRGELRHDGSGANVIDGTIQVQVSYLDGMGRPLQSKTLVEPGLAIQRNPDGSVVVNDAGRPVLALSDQRWKTSGHVVYDAKQRPSRVYEPFFSTTWRFEGDEVLQRFGVSSLSIYDALGRVVEEYLPNGTFTRTTYGAWATTHEDVNDTVLESNYRSAREELAVDDPERQAFEHARAHAGTTTTTFLDPLGRAVGALAHGGAVADRRTTVILDYNGEAREVIDPRGLVAFRYRRDMEGRLLFTYSMDAGDSWVLPDADDRPAFTWDGLDIEVEYTYDQLDRITATHVRGSSLDHRVEERIYGESVPNAAARNILGRLVTIRDQAGEASVDRYDPTGQVLRATQRLRTELGEPDWRAPVSLGIETFATEVLYDALGRPRHELLPDGTIRTTDYLRGGGVDRISVTTPDGRLTDFPIVNGAEFDARGQRTLVRLGNGVEVTYGYDRETARLMSQTARLGSRRFQDIRYSYDPAGNMVRLDDLVHNPGTASLIQGTTISARRDYSYDAHYRLASASGRVHQALLEHDHIPGVGTLKGTRHLTLNNGAALEEFTQLYSYDSSNNIRQIRHLGRSRSWTTNMWISASSNRSLPRLDPGGNQLPNPESHFDVTGNLIRMSHLRRVDWSWRGTLARAVIIKRPGGTDDDEAYIYGADGMRVRKVTTRVINGGQIEVTEKVYFGTSERKRLLRGDTVILERWTTHFSDGQGRVALVHRWVTDTGGRETDDPNQTRVIYQLTTHQNSSAIEIDQRGNLVSYEEYFPYGGTAFVAGDRARDISFKEYRYSGKERDDATSLYYYGHRYYAPWMGRWLSPDPIGPKDHLNLYQFVLGDPVGNIDEDGLQTAGGGERHVHSTSYMPPWAQRVYNSLTPEQQADIRNPQGVYTIYADASGVWYDRRINVERMEAEHRAYGGTSHIYEVTDDRPPPPPGPSADSASETGGTTTPSNVSPHGAVTGAGTTGDGANPGARSAPARHRHTRVGGGVHHHGRSSGSHGHRTGATGERRNHGGGSIEGSSGQSGSAGLAGVSQLPGSSTGPGLASDTSHGTGREAGQGGRSGTGSNPNPGGRPGARPSPAPGGHSRGVTHRGGSSQGVTRDTPGGVVGGTGTQPIRPGTGRPNLAATGGQSGTGTDTGGGTDPALRSSAVGQPAPPGLRQNGTDANGSLDGDLHATRGGTSNTGSNEGTGHDGRQRTGGPGGRSDGSPQGRTTTPQDFLDTLTRWAGYANFEFSNDSRSGVAHGLRGSGQGTLNPGRVGQVVYIALAILSWVSPGKIFQGLRVGGRALIRGVSRLVRGGFVLARNAVKRISLRRVGANVAARAEPFAYGTGYRIERASRAVTEAAKASGNLDLTTLIDAVEYAPRGVPSFSVDPATGRRIITITGNIFGKPGAGQLITATHEIVHAEQWAAFLAAHGGNLAAAHSTFFVPRDTLAYAFREVATEREAFRRVVSYLNSQGRIMSPEAIMDSMAYIKTWSNQVSSLQSRILR